MTIFFLKVSVHNALALSNILRDYQCISGQRINLVKSEIEFSRNVDMLTRSTIMNILGVEQAPRHTKYLRLPLVFRRKKSELFRFL